MDMGTNGTAQKRRRVAAPAGRPPRDDGAQRGASGPSGRLVEALLARGIPLAGLPAAGPSCLCSSSSSSSSSPPCPWTPCPSAPRCQTHPAGAVVRGHVVGLRLGLVSACRSAERVSSARIASAAADGSIKAFEQGLQGTVEAEGRHRREAWADLVGSMV